MLHGAVLRSPYAHARIVSIDTKAAEAHPKVKAVITGATLEALNLAWMPTLSYDTQAVLATDKVRFQGQEVAFVVAEDHYSARDALELIDVEYEPLPAVVDARRALDPDAPVIRDDKDGKTDNHIFDWECRRQGQDRRGVRRRRGGRRRGHALPAGAPGAAGDLRRGRRLRQGHRQADALVQPPRRRTRTARCTRSSPACPSTRSGSSRRTSAAASATRSASTRATCCAIVGSIVTGKPVKWIEDRSENLMSTAFARDYHMRGEIAATRDGKIRGRAGQGDRRPRRVQRHRAADEVPGRLLPRLHRLLRPARRRTARSPASTPTRRRAGSRTPARSGSPRRPTWSSGWSTCSRTSWSMDPAELRMKNLLQPEQFPYTSPTGWEYDSGDYPRALRLALDMAGYDELRAEQAEQARSARRADGHRHQLLHRGGRRRPAQAHGHPRPRHGRRRRAAGPPDRQGGAAHLGADPGPGARDDVRPDRRRGAGHLRRRHRRRARRHRPDAVRAGHVRLPLDAGLRRGDRDRGPQGPRAGEDRRVARCSRSRPTTWSGRRDRWFVARRPGAGQDDPGDRAGRALQPGAARGRRGPPGRDDRLQPAQPDLPVRRVHLRRRRRPGHRRGQGAAVHRGRRLRRADQPDDRRGAGPRRPRRRRRAWRSCR